MTHEYILKRNFNQGISDSYTNLRQGKKNNSTNNKNNIPKIIKIILGIESFKLLKRIEDKINKSNFQKEIENAYWDGYNFHQHHYKSDSKLHDWVHKDTYWK
jgi:hypothetical protein